MVPERVEPLDPVSGPPRGPAGQVLETGQQSSLGVLGKDFFNFWALYIIPKKQLKP